MIASNSVVQAIRREHALIVERLTCEAENARVRAERCQADYERARDELGAMRARVKST